MALADRLRDLREQMNLSQGDIEKRSGLLRCYISRVENGHTIPTIETLEKLARAMEVPIYQLFYDGSEEPPVKAPALRTASGWGSSLGDLRALKNLRRMLSRASESDRKLLLQLAVRMAARKKKST